MPMAQDLADVDVAQGSPSTAGRTWVLLALALFLTAANALKPLTVDDSVYYHYAVHIAEHPLDPYGFRMSGIRANEVLAPPVFLYWWALGVRLFGQEPWAWKLWLLPINLLLVFSLSALGRRFARGMEAPFVCMVALSPVVLPCINLMLDVPAMALGLAAVVLFLRASVSGSVLGAVAAGVVAGLAAQTKYTGLLASAVMLLHCLLFGRIWLGLLAASVAGSLFIGWEVVTALLYGQSHFLLGTLQYHGSIKSKLDLIQPLPGQLGSAAPALILLCLAGLGCSARKFAAMALIVGLAFAAVTFVPDRAVASLGQLLHLRSLTMSSVVFGLLGLMLTATLAMVAWRLTRQPRSLDDAAARSALFSVDGFLVLWLLLELAGYFTLSPYSATRRIMGLVVIGSLLACRLAMRVRPYRLVWSAAAVNLLLALLLFSADFVRYQGERVVAETCNQECRSQQPDATVWLVGDGASGVGASEFYGARCGMKHLHNESIVAAGDWVVHVTAFKADIEFPKGAVYSKCVYQSERSWSPALPLWSQYQYGAVAVVHREQPFIHATLYKVR